MADTLLRLSTLGAGGLAAASFAKGLDFSTEGSPHRLVTYLGFYGASVVFGLLTIVLTVSLARRKRSAPVSENPPINITSHNQSGGFTGIAARTVNVHETSPTIDWTTVSENEPRGEAFVTTVMAELRGRPPMLGIAAMGSEHIDEVDVSQDGPTSALFNTDRGKLENGLGAYMTAMNPSPGRYRVEIVTSQPVIGLQLQAFSQWGQ